ncbi:protein kinase domain-containing protein [Hyalangium rubrum]|uniref:non-specific serine/threonine protein kinase n=1 Tax=Hyalangium rubrum TaxID=3103134 RepID=A0ABU5GYJ4_9BACT|nr:protein kinase [Hyalangium sp. s54d21]MDY7226230.1 protein kinase [Hyalangium sp. s54d21]
MSHASPPPAALGPGTVIAGRFVLQAQTGRGGMGFVYQARDLLTERTVALKLLNSRSGSEAARRFEREARVLSELRHPGIVSYVAHGLTNESQPYLAMDWLEGEDLARRLTRQPLSPAEALQMLRRVAQALAQTHARGIVHRDLKPSNLFLRGGKVEDVVLLDFGLARVNATSQALTASVMVLGTPGYMAPEQASNKPDITPSADIFSLGCVLYECLAGQPPFRAPHLAAMLAKVLFSEPLELRSLRPELSPALQSLVEQMLVKDPRQRLADGQQLSRAVESLEVSQELLPPSPSTASVPTGLSNAEQHLVSVLLATSEGPCSGGAPMKAEDAARIRGMIAPFQRELQAHGGQTALLWDGSLLATFLLERGTATDQAALAAHCALSIQERLPDSLVVLATGLSLRGERLPVGEVMDRAGEFLRRLEGSAATLASRVMLDETTAGLLGSRFELDKLVSGTFLLRSRQLRVDETRPLLGRPTPCVGREQELAILELAFQSCVEDSAARALLVTAPAGMGKSRVRHEFLRRLEQGEQSALVLLGRGDPMNAGSAYDLLGQAVRRLCGAVDGEPLEARRERLSRYVSEHLPPEQVKDTGVFLGELCGIPFPVDNSPKLRAAHEDPRLMSAQVTRAMVAFLRAHCAQRPVLLVLEDLHWSDAPTVRLVEEVLRELAECPLMVLALARPDVKELFPGLWSRFLQEVPLRGLSQKASTRLVQEVLGTKLPEAVVARLVEQAAGNALFLEELIRGEAEGRGEAPPGTVLAMLQSRLQRMEPTLRRVLLAASILGRTFWAGGVRALLEGDLSTEELEQSLRQVVELEVVQPHPRSRFPDETEYRFRHALVRDAAYSLVPDSLKPDGHRLAGAWLEQVGEADPRVLAEHYQLGQQKERAAYFFTRAGERLFERQDLMGAQKCLDAALACEPTGATFIELRALEAAIAFWMEDFSRTYRLGSEVRPHLVAGSAQWGRVMCGMILAGPQSGHMAELPELSQVLLSTPPDAEAVTIYVEAVSYLVAMYTWSGQRQEALSALERLNAASAETVARDAMARGWTYNARSYFDYFLDARLWQCQSWLEQAVQAFQEVGSDRNQAAPRGLLGLTLVALGDVPRAIDISRESLAGALRARQMYAITYSQLHLALVLTSSPEAGHQEEARHLALQVLRTEKVNLVHLGMAHIALARVAAFQGLPSEAEAQARKACELLGMLKPLQLMARMSLCAALLARGRSSEAQAQAEQGVQVLEQMGGRGAAAVGMWLALAEACFAQEEAAPGENALRQAVRCLRQQAEDIPEPDARERFMRQVPENARTLQLARHRWGEHWEGILR